MSERQSNSLIRATKQSLYDQLVAQPYFANIPVYVKIPKSIRDKIVERTFPNQGVAVFIGAMRLHSPDPDSPGPYFNDGSIVVTVVEKVQMNQNTGLPDCDEVGETAMRLFMLYAPLNGQAAATVAGWHEDEVDNYSVREFVVNVPVGFQAIELPTLPAIVPSPATSAGQIYPFSVSLALATPVPGADIFYTLDGSYPAPLNPTAQIFQSWRPLLADGGGILRNEDGQALMADGALLINAPGTLLRARAYLTGYTSGPDSSFLYT